MKESLDKHLIRILQDLMIFNEHFKSKQQSYNDKVGLLKTDNKSIEEISSQLEDEGFELIVLRDDMTKIATEIEIIVELYRKFQEDIPEEYTKLTSEIPKFKENKRLELFTFVVDGTNVVEREKGILKTKWELTKKSPLYKKPQTK